MVTRVTLHVVLNTNQSQMSASFAAHKNKFKRLAQFASNVSFGVQYFSLMKIVNIL